MTEFHAGFGADLRRETDDLWHSILDHPFVRGIGDGTLSDARFCTWLAQDYPYLVNYARVLALGAAAAEDLEGLRFYADQLSMTLTHEMALHRRTCAAFGIDEARLTAVVPDEVVLRYAEHLLAVGRRGVEADLIAALLPCAVGYVEIGESLAARGLPDVPAYRDWIETYTSEPMHALAAWLVARLDRFAADADDAARSRWREAYRASADFEHRFFQMAWEERGAPPPPLPPLPGELGVVLLNSPHDSRTWLLYAVTDEPTAAGRSHEEVAAGALAGGAPVVQLRAKDAGGRRMLELARTLRRLTQQAGAALIVNDRVDVALAADADGVHVGQSDLPAQAARRVLGDDRILGVSATNLDQALAAEADGADYVGFGPIFDARATKPDAKAPTGIEKLHEVCTRLAIPVIAIGGIGPTNADDVIRAGAAGVAVVSAITASPDLAGATRALLAQLSRARESQA